LVIDDWGVVILANTIADKMFGYGPCELLGINIDTLVPESSRVKKELLRECFKSAETVCWMEHDLHLQGVRKDGAEFPVDIGLSSLPPSGARGQCVCASIRDVTIRRAAERTLAESREKLQVILDTSPIAIAFSTDGIISFTNDRFTELLDARVGERTTDAYVNAAERERVAELLKQHKKVFDVNIQMYGTNGQVRDILATYISTEYEGKPGILVWLVDITKIKATEKALTEAEERGRLLLESAGEGIFGMDASGVMTFVNPAALRMLGYRAEELLGRKIHPVIHHTRFDGSFYPSEECPMCDPYTRGVIRDVVNDVLWRKDGSSFYVDYSATPMRKESQLVGAVVTFRDVTEHKKVEEEMSRYVQELERFNQLVIGREEKMIQLKKEINDLREQSGQRVKYKIIE
jgi:PAS domain S-box-containing protein